MIDNNRALPYVSILIAARNETAYITTCLQAIAALSYPANRLQVCIGNDNSTDDTEEKIAAFITHKSNFHLYTITDNMGCAKSKANVLAHLAKVAKGDILLILDADMQVPAEWVKVMIEPVLSEKYDMVTGFTAIKPLTLWSCLQAVEWCMALGIMKCASDLGYPLTAMGNNMLITKAAYERTGGYENIAFSITEDYALFQAARQQGATHKQLLAPKGIAYSEPIKDFKSFLHQRKRWLQGSLQATWLVKVALIVYGCTPLLLAVLLYKNTDFFLWVYMGTIFIQSTFAIYFLCRSKQKKLIFYILIFEPYRLSVYISVFIFYLLPIKVNWKKKKYGR